MANPVVEWGESLFEGDRNLSFTERSVSVVLGLALAAIAAKPRPNKLVSLAALIGGSALAIRGATGHCPIGPVLGHQDERASQGRIENA